MATGANALWLMNGLSLASSALLAAVSDTELARRRQ